MIDRMTKYSFILLSGKAEDFLKDLEGLGVVDITRSEKAVDEVSAADMGRCASLKAAADRLSSLKFDSDPDREKIEAASFTARPEGDTLTAYQETDRRLNELKGEIAAARKEVENRRAWGAFDPSLLQELDGHGLKVRFYRTTKKTYDPQWAQEYALKEIFDDGKNVWFVTVSDDPGYTFPIPETSAPEGDIRAAEDVLAGKLDEEARCKGALLALKSCTEDLRNEYSEKNASLQRYLAGANAGKAAEDHITTFEGFAPESEDGRLAAAFDSMDVLYIKEPAQVADNPPIKLKGNKFTRMFTVLTDMYGRPDYNEFDPTPYLSIFFLLFFAMCMGDAGYGLALIVIGFLLRKSEGMKDLSPLVMTLGAGTFVIGIVMHTFFGYDISAAAWVPGWLKKCMVTGNIAGFDANMVLSIIIGVIHLCLAFCLKAIYATKKNGFAHSLGTWGWTLLIVGGVIIGAVSLTGALSSAVTKWIVIALGVVSAAGIFLFSDIDRSPVKNIGPGLWETYNTATGLLGDVLSYLRLYALGLAGGMLGKAFNDIAAMTLGDGGISLGWIFFAVIFVVGHALNLAMCCLGAFVHPLRLNFLEFFKNSGYEGKGRMYRPITNKQNQ
ncbi:MAG: ATPase V [Bacteroidales bacterium]|nr:ATPase V [Bacteroidales bacterium]